MRYMRFELLDGDAVHQGIVKDNEGQGLQIEVDGVLVAEIDLFEGKPLVLVAQANQPEAAQEASAEGLSEAVLDKGSKSKRL